MRLKSILPIFLLLLCAQFSFAQNTDAEVRMLVNLMDYIAKDYGMAVQNGEVLSEFEYAEMNEFVATVHAYHQKLLTSGAIDSSLNLASQIDSLSQLILIKAPPSDVAEVADGLKAEILSLDLIAQSPEVWPNLELGKNLYGQQCATCHGTYGAGDGPAGAQLNPSPTNFRDKSIMMGVAPFQAFNTVKLGIPGTGMRSFKELSDKQIWDLAFYIESLQHLDQRSAQPKMNISLADLSTLSDEELTKKHPGINVAAHRSNPQPSEGQPVKIKPTDLARKLLLEAQDAYANQEPDKATTLALNAYLQGVEPIEPQIMASDNQLFGDLETSMMQVRAGIKSEVTPAEFDNRIEVAMKTLDRADETLNSGTRSMAMTSFISATILIREGLEAFFVILAILGILKTVNSPAAIRWLHGGWITAVVCGIIGWFFADALLSFDAASRELMEGLVALFAVVILLYLGFWLHGKTEASKWKDFVENRIKHLINQNNMVGLGAFSFIVVFREAFESVLFLSSLTADGHAESKTGVFIGFVAAAVLLFLIAWAILKWFKKLPIRKVFLYSSMVILALAFILAGQGIHAIQEGGFIDIRSFPLNVKLSTLGIYPTYETLVAQLLVLVSIVVLWRVNSRKAVLSN